MPISIYLMTAINQRAWSGHNEGASTDGKIFHLPRAFGRTSHKCNSGSAQCPEVFCPHSMQGHGCISITETILLRKAALPINSQLRPPLNIYTVPRLLLEQAVRPLCPEQDSKTHSCQHVGKGPGSQPFGRTHIEHLLGRISALTFLSFFFLFFIFSFSL